MLASNSLKSRLSGSNPVVHLGDFSFGVYLCHMGFVMILKKVASIVGLSGILPSFAIWAVVLTLSAVLVMVCRIILPKNVLAALGFA